MTAQVTQAYVPTPPLPQPLLRRAIALFLLVALADWLFYGHALGISIVIFLAALCAAALLCNRLNANLRELISYLGIFAVASLPLIEDAGLFSTLIGTIGAVIFALGISGNLQGLLGEKVRAVTKTLLLGPLRLPFDLSHFIVTWDGLGGATKVVKKLAVWVVPFVLGTVFLLLFASANPVIRIWFSRFDFRLPSFSISLARFLFWSAMAFMVWPLVYVKSRRGKAPPQPAEGPTAPENASSPLLFGPAAILRSLAIFNLLFAVQSGLDITYLWAGVSLPNGLSYASYAHQGAYPLIATALLAAALVLAVLRQGSEAGEIRSIKLLIILWIVQNILLVTSSILRLDLYVAVYSLTWLRFSAFIWMLLVAAGLVFILVRIALRRPNRWLIGANCCTLALTLYVTSLLNVPALIARYNVDHCREISGEGVELDISYVTSLGPQALPAIDRYFALRPALSSPFWRGIRSTLANRLLMSEWRGWGFRDERLRRYLARRQAVFGASF